MHLAWLRRERRAEEGVVAHVVRERLRRCGTAAHDASPLAAVEADRRRRADDAGIGALERAERPVDFAQIARLSLRDAVAERRVTREQAERELRAGEHAADGVGLAVGLQGKALVEAGARLGTLGDGQRDADKCEQEAREQCGEGGIAHASAGAGPPKWASARSGVMPTPVKGEARCSRHENRNATSSSPTPIRTPYTVLARAVGIGVSQRLPGGRQRPPPGQLLQIESMGPTPRRSSPRATTRRWISEVPSQMRSTRSSRHSRSAAFVRM